MILNNINIPDPSPLASKSIRKLNWLINRHLILHPNLNPPLNSPNSHSLTKNKIRLDSSPHKMIISFPFDSQAPKLTSDRSILPMKIEISAN